MSTGKSSAIADISDSGSVVDVLMSLSKSAVVEPTSPYPTSAMSPTYDENTTDSEDNGRDSPLKTEPHLGSIHAQLGDSGDKRADTSIVVIGSQVPPNTWQRHLGHDFLQLPHDRALSKEVAFQILTQSKLRVTLPTRGINFLFPFSFPFLSFSILTFAFFSQRREPPTRLAATRRAQSTAARISST